MNRVIMQLWVLTGMVLCLYSCASDAKNGLDAESKKILYSAPFKSLSDSIDNSPKDAGLLLRRAVLLSQNNHHKIATADYQRVYELTNDEEIALMYVSNLLMSEQLNKAVDVLEEGINKYPDNTEFHRRLGEVYLQTGRPEKALEQFDHIIANDSTNFEAWFDKGSLLAKLKDTNAAITALETSFNLLPINYTGIALANLYISQKDPRALEVCNILAAFDSTGLETEPLYMKGVYYSEVGQYDNALKQFEECIRRDWKMTDAYIEKGIIYFERKKFEEALKVFNMAATVSNTDADAYYWIGRCLESTGKPEEAVLNYQRAFSLDNSFTEARSAIHRLQG